MSFGAAGTDNLAKRATLQEKNDDKTSSGFGVASILHQGLDNSVWVDLRWRPRDTNVEADQLTNGDFRGFDEKRRIRILYRDLDVRLLELLQTSLATFEETASELKEQAHSKKGMSKRQKLETKSAW